MALGLPQFCSLVLCFLNINKKVLIASERAPNDLYKSAEFADS